ncbi:hypothetical protein KAR91_67525 [Candidatus Pacearchaeota archaeon]|nr:hypothetical protein [Candidatus Pacearchaeota archaeon]
MKPIYTEKGQSLNRNCRTCIFWTGSKLSENICGAENPECVYMDMYGFSFLIRTAYGKCYREVGFVRFYRIPARIAQKLLAFIDGPLWRLRSKWHNVRSDLKRKADKRLYRLRGKNRN